MTEFDNTISHRWRPKPRLTDEELLQIFREVYRQGREPSFVLVFGEALLLATHRDFILLRPYTLLLIGKYNLGRYLESEERRA